jgi:hypothetical protein
LDENEEIFGSTLGRNRYKSKSYFWLAIRTRELE